MQASEGRCPYDTRDADRGLRPGKDGGLSRRDLLLRTAAARRRARRRAAARRGPGLRAGTRGAAADAGKLVIGAFEDGALDRSSKKIIPLFKQQTGISIQLLTAPYDSFFAKAFQDGQSKAGQYDIYIMDDPWVPQYAAAGILEDLGSHGIVGDAGFAKPFIELGYWPPRSGPRIKGFENKKPTLVALPTIGDLQTMTYRNDVYTTAPKTWHELVTVGQAAMKAGKIKDAIVFRGVKGNPIVTSWYPIFLSYGGKFFDNKWKVTFNSAAGQGGGRLLRRQAEVAGAEGRRRVRLRRRRARRSSAARRARSSSTPATRSSRTTPRQSKEVGKLDFAVVPKQVKAIAQIGIFIHGVSTSAPNKDNAITFMKWFATDKAQTALARPATCRCAPSRSRTRRGQEAPAAADRARAAQLGRRGAPAHARLGRGREHPRHRAEQGAGRRQGRRRRARPRGHAGHRLPQASGLLQLMAAQRTARARLQGAGLDRILPYLLLAPAVLLVLAVVVYPLISGVRDEHAVLPLRHGDLGTSASASTARRSTTRSSRARSGRRSSS